MSERGLPSLNEARAERRRMFVLGKARMPAVPLHFWLWTVVALSAFGVIYWRLSQGEIEEARGKVLARQRAMSVGLGAKLFPFRDRVEGWIAELAQGTPVDAVLPNAELEKIRTGASVYLRLRVANAKTPKTIRKAAQSSLRDGFTSCLFVSKAAPDPRAGSACKTGSDCAAGQLCNEWSVCVLPGQPYNLRLAYRTLRVLSSDWTDEVHQATSELGLLAYDRDLESVAKHDVPVTLEVLTRARYFTLVLDEDPPGGLPAEIGEGGESAEERVQRVPHFARVGIWDLKTGERILRLRTEARGEFVAMGPKPPKDAVSLASQHRQVHGCALALKVREAFARAATPPPDAVSPEPAAPAPGAPTPGAP